MILQSLKKKMRIQNKNKLLTVSTATSNATWNISIASSGIATMTTKSGDRNQLRYNDTDKNNILFACYASGQKDVVIYRKGGSGSGSGAPVVEDPLCDVSDFGYYWGMTQRIYRPGTDQYSRQYSASGVQTFTIIDPETREQLEISGYSRGLVKGDKVTVTVNWRQGLTSIMASKVYPVTVVKEDGPRVWLGDGNGNGFIIKK